MPVTRTYRCHQCGWEQDEQEDWHAPARSVCPVTSCGAPSYRRVLQLPHLSVCGDPVGRFRREFVGRERDGSEAIYGSLSQALQGEREKLRDYPLTPGERERVAQANVTHMRKYGGLLPGTEAAAMCSAIEARTQGGI